MLRLTKILFRMGLPSSPSVTSLERMFDSPKAVEELSSLDVASCDVTAVETALGSVTSIRGWLDTKEAALATRCDHLASEGKGAGARETLGRGGRTSGRKAAKTAARADTLANTPAMADALSSGHIGTDHVDAVTRAASDLTDEQKTELFNQDEDLADAARRRPPDPFNTYIKDKARKLAEDDAKSKFDKQRAATRLRKWVGRDGMHKFSGEYDPETGAKLFAAIDAEIETLAQQDRSPKNDHTAAHALASLVDRGLGAGPNTTPAEIIVIDAATLNNGIHDHTISETSSGAHLTPDTVRRICCDAIITPNTITANGVILNAGRQVRVANRAQRRALRAMYPTCAFGNCDRQFAWCQIHHIKPWEKGGPTDLDNLIPLCGRHHHLVHEGGWTIALKPDRTLVITQRDGRHHADIPLPTVGLAHHLHTQREQHRHRQPSHN